MHHNNLYIRGASTVLSTQPVHNIQITEEATIFTDSWKSRREALKYSELALQQTENWKQSAISIYGF